MEYEELTIEVRSTKGGFEAAVTSTLAGSGETFDLELAPSAEELGRMAGVADDAALRALRGERPARDVIREGDSPPLSVEAAGAILSAALLRDALARPWGSFREVLDAARDRGLRVRLVFDPREDRGRYLASLPWEALRDPLTDGWLARSRSTPVVRDLGLRRRTAPAPITTTIRVLVVDSCPATMTRLDLEVEGRRIEEALRGNRRFEISSLERPDPVLLRDRLRFGDPVHVLHFMGHGGLAPGLADGEIYFEQDGHEARPVSGRALASLLADVGSLRLVVLNACNTARFSGDDGANPYSAVAAAIVRRTRMPAVVAMQRPVSDDAAIEFSRAFYRALAAGDAVEAAVSEGRLALFDHGAESATPVLYLHATHGRLFAPADEAHPGPEPQRAPEPAPPSRPQPLRVGVRSFFGELTEPGGPPEFGWADSMRDEMDRFLPLESNFRGRSIEEASLWRDAVYPVLVEFLAGLRRERQPIELHLAAHQTVAFAAGYVLEVKSGLDITVVQRTRSQPPIRMHPRGEWAPDHALWADRGETPGEEGAPDIAVAVSISRGVIPKVEEYLGEAGLSVSRILRATIYPRVGQDTVVNGDHAMLLADDLARRIEERRPGERNGRVHLFYSGPNAVLFYLGQLARNFGSVQLYEFPFGRPGGLYIPSLDLPPGSSGEGPDRADGSPE